MAFPRLVLPLVLVLVMPAFAGCNFKDWYNQNGTVEIALKPVGTTNTSLGDFRVLRVAVYDVTVKQLNSVDPLSFSYPTGNPLPVDMVVKGKAGEMVPLAAFHTNIRAIASVTIHVDVIEAVDATGKVLPGCHPGRPVETKPCVSTPADLGYVSEQPFSPPRGGKVTFGFPLAVRAGGGEYFIQYDPSQTSVVSES